MSVIACGLCFHRCRLDEGQTGVCRARKNSGGRIISINYGKITSLALDPIEKKPLNRFHPGGYILSCGSFGCNLRCPFCQNSHISFMSEGNAQYLELSPAELVERALALRSRGNIGIAFTYNEPLVSFEFVFDTMKLSRKHGLLNVLVTNGTIEEAPLREILKFTDAMNIDVKGFSESFYKYVGGDFESVRRTVKIAAEHCHVELTTLILPGKNDGTHEMEAEAAWIASIDPHIPLHISRFFPAYHVTDIPPTPIDTILRLTETAKKYLRYVYTGNC